MRTLISGGTIINEGHRGSAAVLVDRDRIARIYRGNAIPQCRYDKHIDATGCYVLPGVIDTHVHFREPGLTAKADIRSESAAAACGGVTSYFDMPNTVPQTTTIEALRQKTAVAAATSHVNYAFYFGATNDNAATIAQLDRSRTPAVKVFMGSSTGNMLVDDDDALRQIFASTHMPIVAHCEDTATIDANMRAAIAVYGDDPPIALHPQIRSEKACFISTQRAIAMAKECSTRLHVAHISTARELALFGNDARITAEAVVAHLLFCSDDYATMGARIKCNPAIKTRADRDALRQALVDGTITTVGTDHAPHLATEKHGGCRTAASGMPMIQYALAAMLTLADELSLPKERIVTLMCHNPATLFGVRERGFLREGYKADIAIVEPRRWVVTADDVLSKCGWSPMEGRTLAYKVRTTLCNGHIAYDNGAVAPHCSGQQILFG